MPQHWLFRDLEGESKPFQNLAGEVVKARKDYLTAKGKIPAEVKLLVIGVVAAILGRAIYDSIMRR